jgi:hypothetical protein
VLVLKNSYTEDHREDTEGHIGTQRDTEIARSGFCFVKEFIIRIPFNVYLLHLVIKQLT